MWSPLLTVVWQVTRIIGVSKLIDHVIHETLGEINRWVCSADTIVIFK